MANVSTSTKGVHNKQFSDISLIQKGIMDLEHLIPLSEETGISVDPMVVTWIYQVFHCLDQDQACILSVATMFGKRLPA